MPNNKKKTFDQSKYQNEWNKQNMKQVAAAYKTDFVEQFKAACKKLGITQSEVIRKAMEETIRKAEELASAFSQNRFTKAL